jgi:hypothetical protein
MPSYRRSHRPSSVEAPLKKEPLQNLAQLLEGVKNNVAIDLKSFLATVYFIGPEGQVKNIVAGAEMIVIKGFKVAKMPGLVCKEQLFGDSAPPVV